MFSFDLSTFGQYAIGIAVVLEVGKLAYTEWTRRQGKPMTMSEEFALCEELDKSARTPEEHKLAKEMRARIYRKAGESRLKKGVKFILKALLYYCPLGIACCVWLIHMFITGTWNIPSLIAIIIIVSLEILVNITGIIASNKPAGRHFS